MGIPKLSAYLGGLQNLHKAGGPIRTGELTQMAKANEKENSIVIRRPEKRSVSVVLLGISPLISNPLSAKAQHELLFPQGRKTSGERANSLKHDPIAEFRQSIYSFSDPKSPTLAGFPAAATKKAMSSAALDIPGAKKAQIGRLVWVPGSMLPLYGVPKVFMTNVRSADMNRTPDMRTRCIFAEWAIPMDVVFVSPMLNATTVINLLVAAGMFINIGDWRGEKGSGNYGQFDVLSSEQAAKDERVASLMKQGRAAQLAAVAAPEPYDDSTAANLEWFDMQLKLRGKKDQVAQHSEPEVAEAA